MFPNLACELQLHEPLEAARDTATALNMNYAIVYKLQSIIMGAIAAAFLLCTVIAKFMDTRTGVQNHAVAGFSFSFLIAATLSLGFFLLGKTGDAKLFRKEALATIGIGWVVASLVGAVPYYLIIPNVGLAEAIFESTSGFTTTGASILSNLETLPASLHFWRALSQWMGGLGVVVFFVAVLSFLGAGAKVLFSRESSASAAELNTSRVQQGVFRLVQIYLGLSILCLVAYMLCGLSFFDSLIHMLTTISTGGFSNRSESIADFNNPLFEWVVIIFMTLGGTSFLFFIKLFKKEKQLLKHSSEVKGYYAILLVSSLILAVFLFYDKNLEYQPLEAFRASSFQVVSIMTTTGFASADFDLWLPFSHILLLCLMLAGGCSGSTAGGVKIIRILVAFKVALLQIEKAYRVRVVRPLRINGKNLKDEDQESVMVFFVLILLLGISGMLLIALFEPQMSLEGTISTTAASLFNIGPGFAEIGPSNTFAFLQPQTLVVLSILMILGRLELFALLVLFAPKLWKRF